MALVGLLAWAPAADGAGRRPYGGEVAVAVPNVQVLEDLQVAAAPHERLLAQLVGCRLLRLDTAGRPHPEIARDIGRWRGGGLELELVDGLRFHDGSPLSVKDVMASFERLGRLEGAPLARLYKALRWTSTRAGELRVEGPPGTKAKTLRWLLARPEAVVMRGGEPGADRHCGAFEVDERSGGKLKLEAFEGHAQGRPWLDRVIVETLGRKATEAEEAQRFRFGGLDLTRVPSPRYKKAKRLDAGGWATVLAIPHPRYREASGRPLRRAVHASGQASRLARYVDWPSEPAQGVWPEGLGPTDAPIGKPETTLRFAGLVVAYPAGDANMAELARALRDGLGFLSSGAVRVVEIEGLSARKAAADKDPEWDLALVVHEWTGAHAAEVAEETAWLLGLEPPRLKDALAGSVKAWGKALVADATVIPLLHVKRPWFFRAGPRLQKAPGGLVELGWSWR